MSRRSLLAAALAALWILASPGVAVADPPGPTDYLSEVTEIDPDLPGIAVEIIGGDSFVLLTVEPGIAVDVVGYSGEPYLRFLTDGTVEENRLAPSKYLNEDRYAAGVIPDEADADADPEWVVVATDGSYAWHDHRTHWMNPMPPPGRGPRDQVAEGVVPLFVDGVEVDVTVASFWQEPPSPLPTTAGLVVGLLAAALVLRERRMEVVTTIGIGAAAAFVGGVAYLSVPPETSPPWSLWVFPFTAVVLAALAQGAGSRLTVTMRRTLLLIAALELVAWGIAHWGWLWAAVLPTSLPFWLDRFVGALTLVGAVGVTVAVLTGTARQTR